ncbi:holin, partial [Escherichia coli]|nr:holin [Escherichia coli]EEW6002661.1 holin [Escherichia coli]
MPLTGCCFFTGRQWPFFIYRRKSMSEPLSGSGTA